MTISTTDADYWTLANGIYEDKQLQSNAIFNTKDSLSNPN